MREGAPLVGSDVGKDVVGFGDGCATGMLVGAPEGVVVGRLVGCTVGEPVGDPEGALVGAAHWSTVLVLKLRRLYTVPLVIQQGR